MMVRVWSLSGLCVVALSAAPVMAENGTLAERVAQQPRPVRVFVERRLECNHWGGEEPYDAARRREIHRAVRALRCNSLEKDEQQLLRRYPAKGELPSLFEAVREAWAL